MSTAPVQAALLLFDVHNDACAAPAEELRHQLAQAGVDVATDPEHAPAELDRIVLLGGDGFLLESLRRLDYPQTPIFGINFGSVGFLMNSRDCLPDAVGLVLGARCTIEEHCVLEARAELEGGGELRVLAFNDFIVERMSRQAVRLIVALDGEGFNHFTGDGFVVSTAAGSTAYNLAARGPVLHPGIHALIVTPLYPHRAAPFTSMEFPLVVPEGSAIDIVVEESDKRPTSLVGDGRKPHGITRVRIADSGRRVRLLRRPGHRFVHTLMKKIIGESARLEQQREAP